MPCMAGTLSGLLLFTILAALAYKEVRLGLGLIFSEHLKHQCRITRPQHFQSAAPAEDPSMYVEASNHSRSKLHSLTSATLISGIADRKAGARSRKEASVPAHNSQPREMEE